MNVYKQLTFIISLLTFQAFCFGVSLEEYRSRQSVLIVPAGNHYKKMPSLPGSTRRRLSRIGNIDSNIQEKFQKALKTLRENDIIPQIKSVAAMYNIDPVHILGALIGEHTFNVTIIDDVQKYVVWMAPKWSLRFSANKFELRDVLQESAFQKCKTKASEYYKWSCYSAVWQSKFRGKTIGGNKYPDNSLKFAFFNPIGSGFTYGLGQLGPVRALMVSDIVARHTSKFPRLSIDRPEEIYDVILETESNIHYIAANIVVAMEIYRDIAGFDITKNYGITATLYNLGKESRT